MENVILTNVAMEVTRIVHWHKAVNLLLAGDAFPLETSQVIKTVNSKDLSLDIHRVMYTLTYDVREIHGQHAYSMNDIASRTKVLIRDNYTCAYCLGYGNTVDHILPKSQGGPFTYGNLITACSSCNSKKRNQTPEEAGMKLLFEPSVFTPHDNHKYKFSREIQELQQILTVS